MTFLIHHLNGLIFDCLSFTEGLITCLPTVESEAPASSKTFVTSLWPFDAARVEVAHPKTINIKQYLSTDNFSVNNRHVVIKFSQATQLYITKVLNKHFSCHHHIKKHSL